MLIVRPNRFMTVLGGIFFTVFGLGSGYAGWRMNGLKMAVGIGMGVFALSMGLHFLYLAATGGHVERITGSMDSERFAAPTSVPQRLALLDELQRRRAISEIEYQQQRARILQDL